MAELLYSFAPFIVILGVIFIKAKQARGLDVWMSIWDRMSKMDTKPLMLPIIPYDISEHILLVIRSPILPEYVADYKRSQYIP